MAKCAYTDNNIGINASNEKTYDHHTGTLLTNAAEFQHYNCARRFSANMSSLQSSFCHWTGDLRLGIKMKPASKMELLESLLAITRNNATQVIGDELRNYLGQLHKCDMPIHMGSVAMHRVSPTSQQDTGVQV